MNMELGETRQDVVAHTELEYTWRHEERKRTVVFDAMLIRASQKGQDMMNTTLSRTKLVSKEGGTVKEVLFKDAPAPMQSMMEDSFGVPVFHRVLNAEGQETSRETTAKPGAKDLVDNGIIVNALLFHPLPPTGKAEWTAQTEVSMGNGGFAKGQLTYKRVEGKPGEVYAVTGTLSNEHHARAGNPVSVDHALYVVTGEQAYESTQQEWVSGNLKMKVTFEMSAEGKVVGKANGTMQAILQRRGK